MNIPKILNLIEAELCCAPWFLAEQFLRCKHGDGQMQIDGGSNPFKKGQGFDYARSRSSRYGVSLHFLVFCTLSLILSVFVLFQKRL